MNRSCSRVLGGATAWVCALGPRFLGERNAVLLEDAGGELVIDRVDRRRLDADQHLALGGLGDGRVFVAQLFRAAIIVNADGLHLTHDRTSFEKNRVATF